MLTVVNVVFYVVNIVYKVPELREALGERVQCS
jgi:hypothetical protein